MAQRDQQAAQQVQALTAMVAKVHTTPEAAQAISQLSDQTITPTAQADGSLLVPQAQVMTFLQDAAQCKADAVELATCKQDLSAQKDITKATQANVDAEKAIVEQKQAEIAALKRKPVWWKRTLNTLKTIAISAGVGYATGRVL